MIGRQEILDFAADFGLDPNVVEKDYVLGWLLAAIGAQREIGQEWLFKGGTCLKKCFFETYRFSEDLDFTSLNPAHIDEPFLSRVFREIADRLYEQAGIELPADTQRFEIYQNPRGRNSVQGRVGYRGPLGRQAGVPRIRLDVTADERVIMEADRREVHHPYSDRPARGFHVLTYRFEELFAEKIRALAERLRPRDLYDVVHLYRRDDSGADRVRIVETLKGKCEFKEIPVPTIAALRAHPELAALRNDWMTMLRHQLPQLPLFDDFWSELPGVFDWLFDVAKRPQAASMPFRPDIDTAWRAPAMGFAWRSEGISAPLEKIRFAAANRLCVDLLYRDESGRVGGRPDQPRAQAGGASTPLTGAPAARPSRVPTPVPTPGNPGLRPPPEHCAGRRRRMASARPEIHQIPRSRRGFRAWPGPGQTPAGCSGGLDTLPNPHSAPRGTIGQWK